MKMNVTKRKGKVVDAKPAELTDSQKIILAIQKSLATERRSGKPVEQISIMPDSLTIGTHQKNRLGGTESKNVYGYPMYSHNAVATIKANKEYNPKPNGTWGNHRFITLRATLKFKDKPEAQWQSLQDVSIVDAKLEEI